MCTADWQTEGSLSYLSDSRNGQRIWKVWQGVLQKLNDERSEDARVSMEMENSEQTIMR